MKCLKCGREISADRVFCTDCLVDMEKYPVKPGAVVLLPRHVSSQPQRKNHFRPILTPEEQIRRLKRKLHRLTIALAVVLLLFAGLAFFLARHMESHVVLPGQNYSAVTTTPLSPDVSRETLAP